MRALGHYIILSEVTADERTSSGLILGVEDKDAMRYGRGVVGECGGLVTTVKSGDRVYFDKRQSFGMLVEGEPVTIIQERDVIVVV